MPGRPRATAARREDVTGPCRMVIRVSIWSWARSLCAGPAMAEAHPEFIMMWFSAPFVGVAASGKRGVTIGPP